MKKISKILSILLIIVLSLTSHAQSNLKYDEVYQTLPTLKPSQGLFLLLQYQKQHPEFSNTYIQIGDLCEKQLKIIDPLREIKQAKFWVNNAYLYYGSYLTFASKGDAAKNSDYLSRIKIPFSGKKITDEDVIVYVKSRIDSCKNYEKKIIEIFSSLEKSKEYYDQTLQLFTDLNNSYENMNELLLHTNDSILNLLDTLSHYFTSSKDLFTSYKNGIKLYPVKEYNQNYNTKPLETFRLDGLTNSDFLKNEFSIWDFQLWLNDFYTIYNKDILSLRYEIETIQDNFNKNRGQLEAIDTISADSKFKTYNELFFYKLGRYDNYSLIKDLFKYLALRQKFLQYGNLPISCGTDSSLSIYNTKLRFYYNLVKMQESVEKEAGELAKKISPEKVSRHTAFFENYYYGQEGLVEFANNEKYYLNELMTDDFKKLKSYLNNQKAFKQELGYCKFKTDSIALFTNTNTPDSIPQPKYITENIEYYRGIPVFVSGYLNKGKSKLPFVAKVNSHKVEWLKYQKNIHNKKARIHSMHSYSNGCITLSAPYEKDTISLVTNYNINGEVVFTKEFYNAHCPLKVKFSELEKNYTLVYGQTLQDTILLNDTCNKTTIYESFHINYVDSLGNSMWQLPILEKGTFVNIEKSGNTFQAYVNAYRYNETASVEANALTMGKWELAINLINEQGELTKTTPIANQKSFTINNTYKISNNQINLIGFWGESPSDWSGKLVYFIINNEGYIEYSNIDWL